MIPKFRAWWIEQEVMCDVDVIGFSEGAITVSNENTTYQHLGLNEVELMQSTGLKDQNGVDIYEGDIAKIDDDSNGEMKAKVVFEQGAFGFVGIDKIVSDIVISNWNDDFLSMAYFSWEYEHLEDYLCNVAIIGNIYENPELLEAHT